MTTIQMQAQQQLWKRWVVGIDPGTVNCGICIIGAEWIPGWKTSRVRVQYLHTHNLVKNKKQSMGKSVVQLLSHLKMYQIEQGECMDVAVERQFRGKMRNVYTAIEAWALTAVDYINNDTEVLTVHFAPYNASDIKSSFGIRCSGHSSNKRNALLAARALTLTDTVKNLTHPIEDDHQADALLIALHHLHVFYKYPTFKMGDVFLAYEKKLNSPPSLINSDTDPGSEGEPCSHSYHDSRCSRNSSESAQCSVHPKLRHKTEPVLPPAPEAPVPSGELP